MGTGEGTCGRAEWKFQTCRHGGTDPWSYLQYLHLHVDRRFEKFAERDHEGWSFGASTGKSQTFKADEITESSK